jgi:hypothetical protein
MSKIPSKISIYSADVIFYALIMSNKIYRQMTVIMAVTMKRQIGVTAMPLTDIALRIAKPKASSTLYLIK